MNFKFSLVLLSLVTLAACSQQDNKSELTISQSDTSIIGGEKAVDTDAVTASTVSLMMDLDGMPVSFCTGTLISKDLVMTAAHCLEDLSEDMISVYFGASLPEKIEGTDFMPVATFVANPDYTMVPDVNGNITTGVNDIAVLRLERAAPASAVPVPVLDEGVSLRGGQSLLLAGYGMLNEIGDPVFADGLYTVRVPLAKVWNTILVTDQNNAKGACAGDSGGPAFLETSQGLVVVGVTRGPHEGAMDCRHYGEYTHASRFKDFLLKSASDLGAEAPRFAAPK